jgi:hypothetical protein
VEALAESLGELEARRDSVRERLLVLTQRRESFGRTDSPGPARRADEGATAPRPRAFADLELERLAREIGDSERLLTTLEKQIEARRRALPLYRDTLETDGLGDALRTRRDHPMHTLLRRMYYEQAPGSPR